MDDRLAAPATVVVPWDRHAFVTSRLGGKVVALLVQPGKDVERHREMLGRIAEIGATWVSFARDFSAQAETLAFVDGFAEHYLGTHRI